MSKEQHGILKTWEATVRKSVVQKKRAGSLFTPMSVAHVDDDDEAEPGQVQHVEKVLSNGDSYTGQWCDNLPHGNGKYLWADGCVYNGEWQQGKIMGKGKFSWPNGASYEGDFNNGFMHGKGNYTGFCGDNYKGSWMMNLKHGQGIESFPTGDYYEGEWVKGLQDGQGKYQWINEDHYVGQWKNGVFHGNGTMVWSNGNKFDGNWENGLPRGHGTFRWGNGNVFVGVWSNDPNEQNGTFYPSSSFDGSLEWDPQEVYSMDLKNCKISFCEKILVYPSQKNIAWEVLLKQSANSMGSDGRPRKMYADGRLSNNSLDDYGSEGSFARGHRGPPLKLKNPKRQGVTISKGHKNFELMLNLQLGIRY